MNKALYQCEECGKFLEKYEYEYWFDITSKPQKAHYFRICHDCYSKSHDEWRKNVLETYKEIE